MTRRALLALLTAAPLLAAAPISATVTTPACCACTNKVEAQATFCAELTSPTEEVEAVARCDAAGGLLLCLAMMIGDPSPATCGAQLADTGINCPIANGAPTLGTLGLGALLIALPGLGIAALRRSSAPRA